MPAARTAWVLPTLLCLASALPAAEIKLIAKPHDPYGAPRPAPKQQNVPLRTSFWFELGLGDKNSKDTVLPESVSVELSADGVPVTPLLRPGRAFAAGYSGKFVPGKNDKNGPVLGVYLDGTEPLRPATKYTVRVQARSKDGATLPEQAGSWQFTTEAAPTSHKLHFAAEGPAVAWHGGFFTGMCNVTFANSHANRIPTFELMREVRKSSPRAWSLGRDFWMTGSEHKPGFFGSNLPNIVRERETRHVTRIEDEPQGTVLHVEDFFGHAQYGIESNRPLTADYHPGDEVLINDGAHDARAKVLAADDAKHTVLVTRVEPPKGGWKLAYAGPLPTNENPNAPGLFPPGGCYLLKLRPHGTPAYYWKRLDHEWDLQIKRFDRRVVVNFADAPGDLSINGRDWTTAKDYAELHEVARAITSHLIGRYGDATLTFPWSVFNEPDLGILFWRSDWNELQKFYDYTVDGILRAFEDHGYDSQKVFIGGLELGGVFGTNLRVKEFLAHCSPRPQKVAGALEKNAAFADARLEGKRSRRVEALCKAHDGRGAPCDFVSIHAYNRSALMAEKLKKAKDVALEIDPEYYAKLWVNSHESCPGWELPPDPAYADSYLGNGYYPTWCADVACRQLRQAANDPRYAYGESLLTTWPAPVAGFGGANDCTRMIGVDDDGDGSRDRTVTVAMPILRFLGLVAEMGPEFRVLPEQKVGGHVVSGFVSQGKDGGRVLLYTHNALDTESRSDASFEITLDLNGMQAGKYDVREFRFDKDHNSYFRLGRKLRDEGSTKSSEQGRRLQEALQDLDSPEPATRQAGLDKLAALGSAAAAAAGKVAEVAQKADAAQRERIMEVFKRITAPKGYPAAVVREVEKLSQLQQSAAHQASADGKLTLTVPLAANGANFLVVQPAK